jgi:DNA modification methylase
MVSATQTATGAAVNDALTLLQGQIELRPIASLKPPPARPRKHSKSQIAQLAIAIQEFGFLVPVLVDADGIVLAGQARLEAAKRLHLTVVPTLQVDHLSEVQKRAFVIADNRLAELAQWDADALAQELQALIALDFPVEVTGFTTPDLDQLLRVVDEDESVPEPDEDSPPVSRLGDLYQLGPHRVLCGDSMLAASYGALLGAERARLVFTDPPYNVPIAGHVTVTSQHREFKMASGEMSPQQFTAFLGSICERLVEFSSDGSLHFICMDFRHIKELLEAALPHYAEFKNLCVWSKHNAGMGSLYRSQHELVFLFKHGTAAHVNNIELGKHGRHRTNVWTYPGATSMSRNRHKHLKMHPTVKPIRMIADAILDCSHGDDLVLDPFGGSGSTLLAAHAVGRRAALIELDPKYVDVIVRRFQDRTGVAAVHAETDLSFDDLALARRHQEQAHGQD